MKKIRVKNNEEYDNLNLEGFSGEVTIEGSAFGWGIIYFEDGFCHRENGPAVLWQDGLEEWWREGKQHRTDGPAIKWENERNDKMEEWWIEGNNYIPIFLTKIIENRGVFLDSEKGKYDLEWLRFFTEEGIKEFPIVSGMDKDKKFQVIFKKLSLNI